MSNVTRHVARPTHLEIFWPHLGNQGAFFLGHGRGLLSAYGPGGSQHRSRGPLHPRRSQGAASPQGDVPHCGTVRQGCCQVSPKAFPFTGEGSVREKAVSLGGGEKAYERSLLPLARREEIDKKAWGHTRESSKTSAWRAYSVAGSSCPSPGTCMQSMRQKPTAVGNHKTSLPAPGDVNNNETSCPIIPACQSAWRIAGLVAPPGYATARNCVTSISHVSRPLWYPLEL
jgi:hypothetical protein